MSSSSRRGFLARPALAGTVLAAPAFLKAQSVNDRVRVAFIGVGNRGSYLLKRMTEIPGVQVIAVCDLDPEMRKRAEEITRTAGQAPTFYDNYQKMIDERKDIDAFVVATPVDTHLKLTLATLETGKHVYCEKPVAGTPAECDTVLAAAKNAKGIYQAGYQLRHDPNRAASMRFIHSGGLGKVLYMQGYRHTGDLPRQTLWLFDRNRSGDNIVEQACHILDLFV